MKKIENISGKKFNQLTALDHYERRAEGANIRTYWQFECVCGTVKMINARAVKSGNTKSCGCRVKGIDGTKFHGHSQTRLYNIWYHMHQRCNNINHKYYARYGGRGIKICSEWTNNFESFKKWALSHGYTEELTIERTKNDLGYSPENCIWATIKTQQQNRCSARLLAFGGQIKNLAQWVEISGISRGMLKNRLNKGMNLTEIFKELGVKYLEESSC